MDVDDKKIKELFRTNAAAMPDNGFTEEIFRKLPLRRSLLPRIIILVSFFTGVFISLLLLGDPLQYLAGIFSQSAQNSPWLFYGILVTLAGSVAFAFYEAENT